MMRPEQIAVRRYVTEGEQADAVLGRVIATEFAGAQCLMTLDLVRPAVAFAAGDSEHLPRFVLHGSAFSLPEPGEMVSLSVNGSVHAFE